MERAETQGETGTEWQWRAPLLAALGALVGLATWLLIGGTESVIAAWRLSGVAFLLVASGVFGIVAEPHRLVRSMLFALICGVVAGLILYWNGSTDRWGASEAWRIFSFGVAAFIAAPLFQASDGRRPISTDYRAIHDHAWSNAVLGAASFAFALLSLAMAWLLASLLDLIGLDFLKQAFETGWFWRILFGAAFGGGLGVLIEQGRVVGLLRRVVMIILSVLAPFFAAGLALFLIALPFTGFSALWDGWASAAGLTLACAVAALLLANAVIGNDRDEMARNRVLRIAALVLAVTILPLAVLASVAIGMRIGQYGFTPERLWALTFAIIASAYGVGYLVNVVRARMDWADRVRPANLSLAIATLVVALVLATPLPSFNAIATRDQVARLESGRIDADTFDWAALRYDFGESGRRAVDRLAKSENADIRAAAQGAIDAPSRWAIAPDSPAVRARELARSQLRVLPRATPVPNGLLAAFHNLPEQPQDAVLLYNLGDPVAVLVAKSCATCPVSAATARRGADGRWSEVGVRPPSTLRDPAAEKALRAGEVEIRTVPRRQVFVGGQPVGEVFE